MVYVKQALAEADVRSLWPHHFPAVAATEAQIVAAERHLGFALDRKYVAFLRHANGWRGFYQTVDLFGTDELSGSDLMTYACELLGFIESEVLAASDLRREDLLPIAATRQDKDLFVLVKPDAKQGGSVAWFAGTEIQRFDDFEEYFLAMVDYNRRQVEMTREKNRRTS